MEEGNTKVSKQLSHKEKLNERRSNVRVVITYAAAFFLFVLGPCLVAYLVHKDKFSEATNLFNALLPVSAAIVSYWFAGRSVFKDPNKNSE